MSFGLGIRIGIGAQNAAFGVTVQPDALDILFSNSEPGFAQIPGPSNCFTDLAGTTPAGPGDTVARFTDQSGNGVSFTQPSAALRPTLGRKPKGGVRPGSTGSGFDITEPGEKDLYYLYFGGQSDPRWMSAPTITPGTNRTQIFLGINKLSDAFSGVPLSFATSDEADANSITTFAPGTNGTFPFRTRAAGDPDLTAVSTGLPYTAPVEAIYSTLVDPTVKIRLNGVEVGASTGTQSGNLGPHEVFIGKRPDTDGGAILPFDGELYCVIQRFGPDLTTEQVETVETYVATFMPQGPVTISNFESPISLPQNGIQGIEVSGGDAWSVSSDNLVKYDTSDWSIVASESLTNLQQGFSVTSFGDLTLVDGELAIAGGVYTDGGNAFVVFVDPDTLAYKRHEDLSANCNSGINMVLRRGDEWWVGETSGSGPGATPSIRVFDLNWNFLRIAWQSSSNTIGDVGRIDVQGGVFYGDYLIVGTHDTWLSVFKINSGTLNDPFRISLGLQDTQGLSVENDALTISYRGGEFIVTGEIQIDGTLTVPAQMNAPTLTGGTEEATLALATPAPDDGGDTITGYSYEVTDSADTGFASPVAQGTQIPANLGTAITVSPLTADNYIARSRAENGIGNGAWSAASTTATVTAAAAPPVDLQIDQIAENSLDLFAANIEAGVTVFQDEAGDVDVTADGDPVRLVKNLYIGGPDAVIDDTNNPATYRTDGTLEWLEFPGSAALSIPFNMAEKEWEHLIAYEPESRDFVLASTGYPFYGVAFQGSTSGLDPANVFTKEIVYDGIGFPVTTRGDFYAQSQEASVLYYRAANNAANAWDPLLIRQGQTPGPMYALLIRGADNLFDSADRLPTALQENAISWAAQFVGAPDPYADGDIEIQED